MASSAVIVFLKDEKLRQLAQLIRNYEVNNLYHITFQSLGDQHVYLRMCNDNVGSVNTLLDNCNAIVIKYKDDGVRRPIADQILGYTEHCLNNALQLIRNYTLRSSYLDKMKSHQQQLFQALEELDTSSGDAVVDFTDSIQEHDQLVMSYMRLNLNSYASAEFSRHLRNVGIGFKELVQSYQIKLGYTGQFEKLEVEQKLEVYAAIIKASGRLSVLSAEQEKGDDIVKAASLTYQEKGDDIVKASSITYRGKKPNYGSAAMFLIDVGQIIWDVYSSDHPITTATRDALVRAAKEGGSALGKLVGVAVATELAGEAVTALFVTAVGIIGGFVGSYIVGKLAGFLFDQIFSSGGEAVLPTDGFIVYVATMPNGHDLAIQINK
ncbi:uncharacterized protein LOC122034469 [Zingiber officinale]|uniref:Uncharacterized protein n=1 Tax=Zingiber officinale TaxID=94328 RepID=A0A8J5C5X4_ZINOF|nr:uncharacterized protein LOC122034469 [Zingiber officinale]KAG6467875.1 hypothetical protein ZIOFF_072439 [Zingiber officinale]